MALLYLVFFPMLAAVMSYLLGREDKAARDKFVIATCAITLGMAIYALVMVARGTTLVGGVPGFCGYGLSFKLDGFRALYALIGGVMWMCTAMLSRQYFAHHYHNRNRYYFFFLMTLGATLGVFLSADLFTTFIFFEVMSFTSYTWVAHDETPGALRAAETYLAVAVIGGMVMLVGLFLLKTTLGTLVIDELYEAAEHCTQRGTLWAASLCILFGFGAKAGMFPLHIWLPKAHPVAPAPASALLSGILTKSGIFGVIVVSANIFRESHAWGNLILVLGLITMLGGAVLAVFSVNLKRTLACSSMSQIGFILTGIAASCLLGEENALAARGALLYMLNHSLFKLILFMAAGVVYMNLHKLDLNDVRGFGRKKPLLHFAFLMGAFGLMGVPLLSGYVSKTLIHEGVVEYVEHLIHHGGFWLPYRAAEWVFLFSGGLTGAYMIKLYVCLCVERNSDAEKQERYDGMKDYMNGLSTLALMGSAVLVPILGVRPNVTMDAIADFAGGFLHAAHPEHAVHYFSATNLTGAGISLGIGVLVYLFFIRKFLISKPDEEGKTVYLNLWPEWFDIEERVYRPFIAGLLNVGGFIAGFGSEMTLETYVYKPMIAVLVFVGAFIARCFGSVTDCIATVLSKTVLASRKRIERVKVGGIFSMLVGGAMNKATDGMSRMLDDEEEQKKHRFIGRLAGIGDGAADYLRQTTHTMSYALILFALGLVGTLLYLMLR